MAFHKIQLTREDIEGIKKLYTEDLKSTVAIGKQYNISAPTVSIILKKEGITINYSERKKLLIAKGIHPKLSDMRKKPWNKGLTKETDGRVFKMSINKEAHKKISKALTQKKVKEETKEKLRRLYLNKTYEELHGKEKAKEIREKMSKSLTGRKIAPEIGLRISKTKKSRVYSYYKNPEFRANMSKTLKENYTSGKLVPPMKGKHHTKETLEKLETEVYSKKRNKTYEEYYGKEKAKKIKNKIKRTTIFKEKELHPNWQGGKSFEPYTPEFNKNFKNQIRKRDNQICMNCGVHREKLNEALHIHHINYDKELTIFENCICLCRKCHSLTNFNREYWIKLFQEKLSRLYNYKYDEKGNVIININNEAQKSRSQ